MNNKYFTVCGLLLIDGRVLLVRHTYGTAKDRILLRGGYVQEGELPTAAAELGFGSREYELITV